MQLFYAVLTFVMAVNNLMKGIHNGSSMNYVMAAMWLAIGIVFTVKYVKDAKSAKKRKQEQNKEV